MATVLALRTVRWLHRALGRQRPEETLPRLPSHATPAQRLLLRAWDRAQLSRANAPAVPAAYYSLDYEGVHFPGRRAWERRWAYLATAASYEQKRVLELGCNMGLLSTYAMVHGGAAAAMGVDADDVVLEAAGLVARALGATPTFFRIDFDAARDWESRLVAFRADLVCALSVLHWVKDKARFLAFLGTVGELLFEGHDDLEVETARLQAAGFTRVTLICLSERGRPVLYCRRD